MPQDDYDYYPFWNPNWPTPKSPREPKPEAVIKMATVTGEAVNHPSHYTSHPSGIECIQVTEHMNFNLGNAVKYIWRASLKGKQVQDLEKAIWYLRRELKRLNGAK